MGGDFDWRDGLEQLFAAYVNQSSLEEAADHMVLLSEDDSEFHAERLFLFDKAESLITNRDEFIIHCINRSGGYTAQDFDGALLLVRELKALYLERYRNAVGPN
jgi:hypothetical protein